MNVFDKFFLRFFLLGKPFLRRLDVNANHLEAILTAKLTMDNRRVSGIGSMGNRNQNKEPKNSTLGTMLFSLVMGLMFLVSFATGNSLTSHLTVFYSMFIFMLSGLLITDFTSVLLDVRDNYIIIPKPVNDATFIVSRLLHIAIHISKIVVPLVLPTSIAVVIQSGLITFFVFLVMVLLSTLFTVFLINGLYLGIIRITTPEKFQGILTYIQILFAILIFSFYQIMPRLVERLNLDKVNMEDLNHIRWLPTFWFAEATSALGSLGITGNQWISVAASILVPVVSLTVVIKFLAPAFNRRISALGSGVSEPAREKKGGQNRKQNSYSEIMSSVFTRDKVVKSGFLFSWKMMLRSREFKLKIYPTFGYFVVMTAMFFINEKNLTLGSFSETSPLAKRIFLIMNYFFAMVIFTSIFYIGKSEKFRASWIFYVVPIDKPGKLIKGAVISLLISLYFPVLLVFSSVFVFLMGVKIIPDLILAVSCMFMLTSVLANLIMDELPFSNPYINAERGKTTYRNLIGLFIAGLCGLFHYFIFGNPLYTLPVALVYVLAGYFALNRVGNLKWERIKDLS